MYTLVCSIVSFPVLNGIEFKGHILWAKSGAECFKIILFYLFLIKNTIKVHNYYKTEQLMLSFFFGKF